MSVDYTACPARALITDLNELIEHDDVGCDSCTGASKSIDCAGSKVDDKLDNDEPMQTEKTIETKSRVSRLPNRNNNRKSAIKKELTAEEKETNKMAKLPVKLQIKKLQEEKGLSKGAAAINITDRKRQAPQIRSEKESVDRELMPWCPPAIHLPFNENGQLPMSCLPFDKHKRYVAIVSNFLRRDPNFRFELNRLELQGYDEILSEERQFYETECMKQMDQMFKNPYGFYKPYIHKLYKNRMLERVSNWPEAGFQKVINTFDWQFSDPRLGAKQQQPTILAKAHSGRATKIVLPEPRRRCLLPNDDGELIKEKIPANRNPIEEDEQAVRFMMDNNIEILMSACTLRNLLVMPWVYRDQRFAIKVSVRRKYEDGRFRSYIVFSKPVLASALSTTGMQRQYQKWMLKCEVMKGSGGARKLKRNASNLSTEEPAQKRVCEPMKTETIDPTISTDELMNWFGDSKTNEDKKKDPIDVASIPINTDLESFLKGETRPSAASTTSTANDLLGDILKDMGGDIEEKVNIESGVFANSTYRYSVVQVGDEGSNCKLLIRSTTHGLDENGQEISLSTKLDYFPAIGAEKFCEEELLWNYFTGLLKGSQTHLTVRVHPNTSNVLQMERRIPKQMYVAFSQTTRQLVSQRTDRVSKLIESIKELTAGEYLLVQSGETMNLLSQTIDNEEETIWNERHIRSLTEAKHLPLNKPTEMWKGIDIHLPLVWHIVTSRAPGSLMPYREGIRMPKPQKKPNTQKKHKKSKNRGQKRKNCRNRSKSEHTNSTEGMNEELKNEISNEHETLDDFL